MIWAKRDNVFSFKYFDIIKQQYRISNATTYESAKEFRNLILKCSRYKYVGDIYERDISKPYIY